MIIIKAKDYDELSKKAATMIVNEVMLDPSITIGFATGSTPLGLYKALIGAHKNMGVSFSKITTFNLDEYYPIDKENEQSYSYFMYENLFKYVNIDKNNINILDGSTKNPEKECADFENKIRKTAIDIQILGIGANGHIAFNEPGSSFNSKTRVVNLDERTIEDNSRFFKSSDEVPKKALSMGLDTIMSAKKIILLATGVNKAEAVKKMIEGPMTADCPASILQKHPDVVVVVDEDASRLLDKNILPSKMGGYKIIGGNHVPKNKKVIVISPHPDDSCIGAGATMSLFSKKNEVHTFIMTAGHRAFIPDTTKEERADIREDEVIDESRILKSTPHFLRLNFYDEGEKTYESDLKKLILELKEINPDIVMVTQFYDSHPTHQMSRKLVIDALKKIGKPVQVWSYESPWGLFNKGNFNSIVSLEETHFQDKINSIKAHKSQVGRTGYDVAAEALAKLRGALIPEQELFGWGNKNFRISPYLELFQISELNELEK